MSVTPFAKILGTATLNEKGQLVIPAEARTSLGLSPGSKVVIMRSPDKPALIIIKAEEIEAIVRHLTDALESDKAQDKDKEKSN